MKLQYKDVFWLVTLGGLFFYSQSLIAHTNVVVIPLSGDESKPIKNVITVAKANGDFSDPVAAMASIIDANIDNPYLMVIAPGTYTLSSQLVMKEYVDVTGSGRNSTRLRGSISNANLDSSGALILGASNASLNDVSIENNDGANTNTIGIFNDGVTNFQLAKLNITIQNSSSRQFGVYNKGSSSDFTDVSVFVSGGGNQYGVYNIESSSSLNHMKIEVSGGGNQFGVFNFLNSSATLYNMRVEVFGGSGDQYGVNNTSDTFAHIRNSTISASTNSIRASTGSGNKETYVSDSVLIGEVSGDPACSFVFTGMGVALLDDCQAPE